MKGLFTVLTILIGSVAATGQQCNRILITRSDTIFLDPDKVAHPEEGRELYFGWISNNMNQKLRSRDEELRKQVFLSFVVGEDGRLSNFKIEKGAGNPYDREALRLIKKHPHKWIPGECSGRNVKSKIIWFVNF